MTLRAPLALLLVGLALATCRSAATWAFVALRAQPPQAAAAAAAASEVRFRGSAPPLTPGAAAASIGSSSDRDSSAFTGASSFAILLLAAAAGAAARVVESPQVRQAAAKKKNKKQGVRVVEGREIPWNLFTPKAPYKATVVANHKQPQTLTERCDDPNWETVQVTIDHGGNFPYMEGQSLGLIAPGPDKKGESPAKLRLYSIASSATGDDESSRTVSLCVKRLVQVDGKYANREVGEDQPDKAGTSFPDSKVYRGVASNYVADLSPGDEVLITGPSGAEMLLPDDPEANIIMLGTGTGIAPMRGYLRLLFNDKAGEAADGGRKFKGKAWLFLGVPRSSALIYDDEHKEYKAKYPEQFRYDYAVSREQTNEAGEKMYIQTKMEEYAEELWEQMQDPKTHIYMCGLKGMEKGIQECFGPLAEKHGVVWKDFAKAMKKAKRYHVEVY